MRIIALAIVGLFLVSASASALLAQGNDDSSDLFTEASTAEPKSLLVDNEPDLPPEPVEESSAPVQEVASGASESTLSTMVDPSTESGYGETC